MRHDFEEDVTFKISSHRLSLASMHCIFLFQAKPLVFHNSFITLYTDFHVFKLSLPRFNFNSSLNLLFIAIHASFLKPPSPFLPRVTCSRSKSRSFHSISLVHTTFGLREELAIGATMGGAVGVAIKVEMGGIRTSSFMLVNRFVKDIFTFEISSCYIAAKLAISNELLVINLQNSFKSLNQQLKA